jgi:hypothetical protein
MSPTALTLRALRRSGFLADVVERWLPHVNRRRDLFGCIDIVAIDWREPGILAVQTTSIGHVADRLAKARRRPELTAWLRAGGRFEVHGWAKRGERWRVKIVAVHPENLEPMVVQSIPRRQRGVVQSEMFAIMERSL